MTGRDFSIDPGFMDSCFRLGRFGCSHMLLMNNSALPWFVLVPETEKIELCDLDRTFHDAVFDEVRSLSLFIRNQFQIDKINIGCNGNVIRQMHIHVVGRRFDDYCWPDVVWGTEPPSTYSPSEVNGIEELCNSDPRLLSSGFRHG